MLQLYKNQEKVAEHIAAEGSKDAVGKVGLCLLILASSPEISQVHYKVIGLLLQIKSMIQSNLNTAEVAQEAAG